MAIRELLRAMQLGEIAGKTFVIQVSLVTSRRVLLSAAVIACRAASEKRAHQFLARRASAMLGAGRRRSCMSRVAVLWQWLMPLAQWPTVSRAWTSPSCAHTLPASRGACVRVLVHRGCLVPLTAGIMSQKTSCLSSCLPAQLRLLAAAWRASLVACPSPRTASSRCPATC